MINRRRFAMLLGGSIAAPWLLRSEEAAKRKTVFYSAVGGDLTLYSMDIDAASLTRRNTVTVPVNIQYAWPHPLSPHLYVASSSGGPGAAGARNFAHADRKSTRLNSSH